MFLFIRYFKKKIQNTFLDKILRISINKISPIYLKFSLLNKNTQNNNVFVFICYGGMGDCILTFPFINELSKNFSVILLIEKKFENLKNLISHFVDIHYYEKNSLFNKLKNISKLENNYILIQQNPIFEFIFFHYFLNRPPIIGYIYSQKQINSVGFSFQEKQINSLNKINKYQEILCFINSSFKPSSKIKDKNVKFKKESVNLQKFKLAKNSYFVISPTKNPEWKMGFLEFNTYAEILMKISSKTDLKPVIIGTNEDKYIIENIIQHLPKKFNFLNLCGKTTINDIIVLIQKSKFVIANDNGIHHLSNFLKMRTLTLYNFSSPEVYNWNNNSEYLFNPIFSCMPCIGNNLGPFDNYPFKCPWDIRCKKTINANQVMKKLLDLNWIA